jgi:2-polyprenyl-3-methyl-5-hydroxy-6-metoxy-1,4-benzoquinol methylase
MNVRTHWDKIYAEKSPDTVSWYRPHLETSLKLIERAAPARSAPIIDVGGGESTLVDDLLAHGYKNVTVLDVSQTAIDASKRRIETSERVEWIVADITKAELPPNAYDVWHDRAVFHFLTAIDERTAYVRQVARAVKPRGHVIVSTFGPEGPTKCSGLDVVRYDAESLHKEFGVHFRLLDHSEELHAVRHSPAVSLLFVHGRMKRVQLVRSRRNAGGSEDHWD